ncbi:unnamed protein product, partial [marine sediment metagenome]
MVIRSNGRIATIPADGWIGEPVAVRSDPDPQRGTILAFDDDNWTKSLVEPLSVFSAMQVVVEGEACVNAAFVGPQATHHPELGCRIEVRDSGTLHPWHRSALRGGYSRDQALVNFHGQVVAF